MATRYLCFRNRTRDFSFGGKGEENEKKISGEEAEANGKV